MVGLGAYSNMSPTLMSMAAQKQPLIQLVDKMPRQRSVLSSFFDDSSETAAHGMRPPGASSPVSRKSIIQASAPAVKGSIDVNFNNAPQGMRIEPAKSAGNVSVKPNVGYRSFATGMP